MCNLNPLLFWRSSANALRAFCFSTLVHGALSVLASAQVPEFTINGPGPSGWRTTAVEAWANLGIEDERTMEHAAPVIQAHYPKDSMLAEAARRAQTWVTALQASPVTGLQLDPYGIISVVAYNEKLAQQQIAARLAEPGLSVHDRAYTLYMGVASFASADVPKRIPVAEKYIEQLDALGTPAAYWQVMGRCLLVGAYFQLGRSADVIRVGTRAFALVNKKPYEWMSGFSYMASEEAAYFALVVALSGEPDGRERIRAMNKVLMEGAAAPRRLIERDNVFWSQQQEWAKAAMQGRVDISERIGRLGTPLVADYWINRGPGRDSQTVAVTDGKIRVVELGGLGCEACVMGMLGLERLHQQHPDVEFITIGGAGTTWGNRVVGAEVVADRMADHIVNNLHITYPYGILMPKKTVTTEDDGEMLVAQTTMFETNEYPMVGKPNFYILDSHGTVRFFVSGYSRENEKMLATVIAFLQKDKR